MRTDAGDREREAASRRGTEAALDAYLAGQIGVRALAEELSAREGQAPGGEAILSGWVRTGRLSKTAAALVRACLGARRFSAPSAAPATSGSPGKAAKETPNREQEVTWALLGALRVLRRPDSTRGHDAPTDLQIDAWLAPFRTLRIRRQADAARAAGGLPGMALPAGVPEPDVGFMLKERFVLEAAIGEGGMGRVFQAVDRRRLEAGDPDPSVAVKLVSPRLRQFPEALSLLEAEAHRVQRLAHPNICQVFDFDRDGAHAFFVMELLQGETLEQALARTPGVPLPRRTAADVVTQLLEGLAHAHAHGVVHGDLKPGNIFLCGDGAAKLLDFGVAGIVGQTPKDAPPLAAFTPAFSSPECCQGTPAELRDDVFSAGCLLYLIYSGRHPFDRIPGDVAARLGLVPPPLPLVAAEVEAAIRAALSFARADRPRDAGALSALLLPGLAARRRADTGGSAPRL